MHFRMEQLFRKWKKYKILYKNCHYLVFLAKKTNYYFPKQCHWVGSNFNINFLREAKILMNHILEPFIFLFEIYIAFCFIHDNWFEIDLLRPQIIKFWIVHTFLFSTLTKALTDILVARQLELFIFPANTLGFYSSLPQL